MKHDTKILIGYDGSSCSEAALDDLQRAGLPYDANVVVFSVTEVFLPPPPPSSYEILEQGGAVHVPADLRRANAHRSTAMLEAQAVAELAADRLRINYPGWKLTVQASVGSPAKELIAKADEWKPDLIVVGSHGRTAAKRLVLGSVSQGVLTYARSSVRVARGRVDEPGTPVRIVIGVDGSPASLAAVSQVASRAWPPLSEVRVIAVDNPLTPTLVGKFIPPVTKFIEETNQSSRRWLKKILTDVSRILRQSDLQVVTEIREGDPKRALVEAAEKWGADCIFVGSIGFGNPFERFVLGSVSAAVAARAHCSVEVVRPQINGDNYHERQSYYSSN